MAFFVFAPHTACAEKSSVSYLYEQLRNPSYETTFNALFNGQHNLEPWVKEYLKNRNGVETPAEMRVVGGKTYEFYTICQPHNCPENRIYVFFEQGGSLAWAFFTKDDGTTRFFGNPDIEMQTALMASGNGEIHLKLDKSVDAPTVMVGDSYTFEVENTSDTKLSYVATREVTAIDGNRMTIVTTNAKSGRKRTTYYDRTWGYLGSGTGDNDGVSFSPALKYLDFPLSVGKKWTMQSTETDKKTGHQRQHTINGTVEGWEKVQVPAGEFEALKIVLKTEVKDGDKVSPGTDVSWYVPALWRSVKSELTGLDVSTEVEEKKIIRLLSYHKVLYGHDRILHLQALPK